MDSLDVITIGRALWYLKPEAVLPRLDRWLKPGGRIVVCSTGESEFGGAIWDEVFLLLIERWKRFPLPTRSWTPQDFFRDSLFAPAGRIEAYGEWRIDLDSVVKRFFGMPQTSTAALGADAPRAERDVRALQELGYFKKVDMSRVEGSGPDQTVIDVNVEEQPTGSLNVGAGYSTTNGIITMFSISELAFASWRESVSMRMA